MSDDDTVELHLDPVADGRPSFGRTDAGLMLAFVLLASVAAYYGELAVAASNGIFAGYVFLSYKYRRSSWVLGYYTGAKAVVDQVDPQHDP